MSITESHLKGLYKIKPFYEILKIRVSKPMFSYTEHKIKIFVMSLFTTEYDLVGFGFVHYIITKTVFQLFL